MVEIDVALVRRLMASQFPHWAHLPVERVEPNGWDNRTFRIGSTMSARLPSHERYVPQVEKEHRWLPHLAPLLPVSIPKPVARGMPGHGYPWSWSIYEWLEGETVSVGRVDDLDRLAGDLAQFLRALHQVAADDGPSPGEHNFFRGGAPAIYDAKTREAIEVLGDRIDSEAVTGVWEAALTSEWRADPVWLHGDLAPTNMLVRDGRLSAVIDFGVSGVGDPSCDLAVAWTLFEGRSRQRFRELVGLDADTWARARGWTLWKRVVELSGDPSNEHARSVLAALVAEHEAEA